jgi:Glycosyltransferase 61
MHQKNASALGLRQANIDSIRRECLTHIEDSGAIATLEISMPVVRPLLLNNDISEPIASFAFPEGNILGPLRCLLIPHATIHENIIPLSNGLAIEATLTSAAAVHAAHKLIQRKDVFPSARASSSEIDLFCLYHIPDMYSHFLVYCVLRVLLSSTYSVPFRRILFPGNFAGRLAELIALLEIKDVELVPVKHISSELARHAFLWDTSYYGWTFVNGIVASGPLIDTLSDKCCEMHQETKSIARVYITRGKAKMRRLLNETALIDTLQQAGFYILDCGIEPLSKQIAVLSSARHVLAGHGAAALNVMFGKAGATYTEILPSRFAFVNYAKEIIWAAQARGMKTETFFADDLVVPGNNDEENFHADTIVDIPSLMHKLSGSS